MLPETSEPEAGQLHRQTVRRRNCQGVRPAAAASEPTVALGRPATTAGAGEPSAGPPRRLGLSAPEPLALHLRLRPQGGGALFADRGDAVVALGPAAVRARRGARRAAGRRRQEVSNYVAALDHGCAAARRISALESADPRDPRGPAFARDAAASKEPGEFRRSQNWIGGTRPGNAAFVPPPPDSVAECMGALERFLHDDRRRTSRARQGRRWPTCSSRPSIRSSTATAGSAGCSSRSCCARRACCASRSCI